MFLLIFILILLGRLNSSIFGFELLNTDEFIIGAKAMRLINDFSITKFDGDTSGILNAIFLTWPGMFDLDISYLSIRISGILAISLIIYFTFKIIDLKLDRKFSIILSLPLIIFFSLTKDPDFLHYTNELISTLLIIISIFLYFKNIEQIDNFKLSFISLILGSVLFSKMQFFPIACLIFLLINFKSLFLKKDYRSFLFSTLGFLFPVIFFSVYYYLDNELTDLFYNVIHFPLSDFFSRNEVIKEELVVGSNNLKTILASDKKNILFNHLILNSLFHLFYLYFLYFIFIIYTSTKLKIINFTSFVLLIKDLKIIMLSLIIIFTLIIILITGSVHRHYFISLIPVIPIFLAYVILNIKEKFKYKFEKNFKFLISLILLFILSVVFENKKFYSKNFVHKSFSDNKIRFISPEIYQYLKLNKNIDQIIIWGWKPEIYLLSGLTPSNRETANLKQIDYRPGRDYYRKRFLDEFDKSSPEMLVDYAKSGALFYGNPDLGVKNFEELNSRLKKNYIKINASNFNCPDHYLRKDKFIALDNKLLDYVVLENNELALNKLNDFNFDINICDTEVIFSNNSPNQIKFKINDEKKINEIKILSAKINNKSVPIKLEIYKNTTLLEKRNIYLNKNPFWTNINFKNGILANTFIIDVEELKKNNFGISEIKIFN